MIRGLLHLFLFSFFLQGSLVRPLYDVALANTKLIKVYVLAYLLLSIG